VTPANQLDPGNLNSQLGDRLLVIYDGYCGLCNASIQWLIRHDRNDRLRFIPSHNHSVANLLAAHPQPAEPSGAPGSVLVVRQPFSTHPEVFVRSRAALSALRVLPAPWPAVSVLLSLVPAFLADPIYRLIARWRYRIWGRLDVCPIPTSDQQRHFFSITEVPPKSC
jgi:predicted DCC family thiol-disulfide oxidoreductase YuxK